MTKFWSFTNKAEDIELRIEGEIISDDDIWFYEWLDIEHTSKNQFRDELNKHDGKDITVWIDSYGGDVFAAAGIYNALMEHKGNVTVKIDGKAMSAASVIAMAGGEILMSPVSIMMIHNPLTMAVGDMHEMRHTADILDTVKETIINAYQIKTGKSRKKISEMMDGETFMSGKVAVKDGFADGILYEDSEEPIKNYAAEISFNRLAVQNSAKSALNKMIDLQKELNKPEEELKKKKATAKAKLGLKLKLAEVNK